MPSHPTIAAVIVTHNRSAKLARVLQALAAQSLRPDQVHVIDNASTDDTAAVVAAMAETTPGLRYHRLPTNIGGAGGFHHGMKQAYDAGADYLWVSDDDAYPAPDAIEQLFQALQHFEQTHGKRPSFACSRVNWVDGVICEMNVPRPVWDWPRYLVPDQPWPLVDSCSFVSILIPRWALTQHGLPIAEYFIWFDDAEFTRRLSKTFPGILVPASVVTHDTAENKGVNFGFVTEQNLWKFVYGARNETSFLTREFGFLGTLPYIFSVHYQMAQAKVPWSLRRRIFRAIISGWVFKPKIPSIN
jgi:GT2 family glycosyltransferase